ncbi:helix-turn-helix domain-containing protein [Streptomyces sp. NPDC006265]|uniref:helix-turn-helix domain-containing protein n=1 Tax=Streptomyces sp. NPDC006265 TaxID=3156740 RepID=UPI0033A9C8DB
MATADDDAVSLLLPLVAVPVLEDLLARHLVAAYRTSGGRPAPAAQRALHVLHEAAQGRSSVPGTSTPAPARVDHGFAERVLSAREAAAVLGCTAEYVRRLARTGHLRAHRVGGVWAVRPQDLDAYRYGRTEGTDGEPGPAPRERATDSD